MAISAESTSTKILVSIQDDASKTYILQKARHDNRTWLTLCADDFWWEDPDLSDIKYLNAGNFVDARDLRDGLYEYRYIVADGNIGNDNPNDSSADGNIDKKFTLQSILSDIEASAVYSEWVKFGNTGKIGYSFGNYSAGENDWGEVLTADDLRFTFLWGTDLKATNGTFFTDDQIRWFICEAVRYMERELNITIKKRVIKASDVTAELTKSNRYKLGDYDDEEALYDFSYRKIQRYGMIRTRQRPVLKVQRVDLINRDGQKMHLLNSVVLDKQKGVIKFLNRPYKMNDTKTGIASVLGMYGTESVNCHLFYAVDYEAGFATSDDIPEDLRQIIGKVAAISLLNIIGDGLMSGFSSSSLSMDGISESFSSTQSATSAYFGARIAVYKDDVKKYIKDNKFKFNNMSLGTL